MMLRTMEPARESFLFCVFEPRIENFEGESFYLRTNKKYESISVRQIEKRLFLYANMLHWTTATWSYSPGIKLGYVRIC